MKFQPSCFLLRREGKRFPGPGRSGRRASLGKKRRIRGPDFLFRIGSYDKCGYVLRVNQLKCSAKNARHTIFLRHDEPSGLLLCGASIIIVSTLPLLRRHLQRIANKFFSQNKLFCIDKSETIRYNNNYWFCSRRDGRVVEGAGLENQ